MATIFSLTHRYYSKLFCEGTIRLGDHMNKQELTAALQKYGIRVVGNKVKVSDLKKALAQSSKVDLLLFAGIVQEGDDSMMYYSFPKMEKKVGTIETTEPRGSDEYEFEVESKVREVVKKMGFVKCNRHPGDYDRFIIKKEVTEELMKKLFGSIPKGVESVYGDFMPFDQFLLEASLFLDVR